MPVYVWQCSKCAHNVEKDARPNTNSCSEGGYHQWQQLGEAGSIDYLCSRCGTQVQTKSQPTANGCSEGGYHRWTKL